MPARNAELESVLRANLVAIVLALESGRFVEIGRDALTVRA